MKLKWQDDGLKGPLARAKGLGSAGEGSEHWFMQRVTAISNLILMIWLLSSVVTNIAGADHAEFTAWLSMPINAILMILSVISIFYHAALGCQVIAEDYIHNEALKFIKLIGIKLFFFGTAVACIFSILKIAFGG